jgi:hypothetical protein
MKVGRRGREELAGSRDAMQREAASRDSMGGGFEGRQLQEGEKGNGRGL